MLRGAFLSTFLLSHNRRELCLRQLRINQQRLGGISDTFPASRCALPISATDAITLAVEHTKQQLFRHFRLGQWTKLAVVGLLAGELGSSGGFNGSSFNRHTGGVGHSPFPGLSGIDWAVVASLLTVIVIAAFVLGILFMYISSVMRFVLFDSIVTKECHIREGWARRQGPGWRYFLWKLVYSILVFAGIAVMVGIPAAFAFSAGWFHHPGEHVGGLVLAGIAIFFALAIFFIVTATIFVLTKDFVVPQMALENIGAFEAWGRLWTMIEAEKGGYAAYIGMKIVLAIAAGIVIGIATVILGFLVAIPTIGLSILAVLTGKSAGLTWNAYTITLAILVGCGLFAIFFYLIALISVPDNVFFTAYSIYFFAARYPALSTVLYPAAASPQIASWSPPFEPPPLPPSPSPIG